jgi:TolB-like protein
MKRFTLLSAALGLALASTPAMADVAPRTSIKKTVAVLPFSSPTRYSYMGRNAQSTFITQLVKTRQLKVIQATMVSRMLRRRGLHWTGVISPKILKAAGRWLKADYMMVGKIRYTGGAYTLSVHVADVNTLQTTHAEDVDFRNTRKMRVAVRIMARKIAGVVSGKGHRGGSSKAGLFLNVNPRAFYDTSAACIKAMKWVLNRYNFSGKLVSSDESKKTIKVSGYRVRRLKAGVPIDVFDTTSIDGKKKVVTAYVTKIQGGKAVAKYRMGPSDGVPLDGVVSNKNHKWVVAVGKIVDEAEANKALVTKFRSALLQKMSEGSLFQQVEGSVTDYLAKLSNRKRRFFAYRKLFRKGVELVLEGKFYGSSGRRRAHFKFYSTLTGKVFGELKFETRL